MDNRVQDRDRVEHRQMYEIPDPDWYFENVLQYADPGPPRKQIRGPVADWRAWWADAARATDPAVRVAALHGFVLTPTELASLDITRSRARNETSHGRWTQVGRGGVAPLSVKDARDREELVAPLQRERRRLHALACASRWLARPGSIVSGRSGAILHGLPTFAVPRKPELTERDAAHGHRPAAHLFAAMLPADEVTTWYGVDVETVGRTLVSLARHGRRDAIMAADAALRENLIDRAGIVRALDTAFGWPWVRQARAVLALADGRAESPLESITRLALRDSGFPEPLLQVRFGDDRVDFYWPKYKLVLEADGMTKYVGDASLREKRRERRLLRDPQITSVERVAWTDIVDSWPTTAADLATYFR